MPPCIPLPKDPIPKPPDGLTLTAPVMVPPIPEVPGIPCCKLPILPPIPIPTVLPSLTVNPAFLAVLHKGLDAIDAWEASIPLNCPRS